MDVIALLVVLDEDGRREQGVDTLPSSPRLGQQACQDCCQPLTVYKSVGGYAVVVSGHAPVRVENRSWFKQIGGRGRPPRMSDRSSDIEYVRAEIQVLRDMIDDALDNGAGSEDVQLNTLASALVQRRKLLQELESLTLYVSRPSNA